MSEEYKFTEYEDYWTIPLRGKPVCRFLVDSQLTIEFLEPESEETMIVVGGEFRLEIDGKEYALNAEEPTTLGPVFALYRRTVESALAFKEGRLEVKFLQGGKLSVMPHPDFESWNIAGVRGLCVVCTPGGELAIWQPDPPGSSHGRT